MKNNDEFKLTAVSTLLKGTFILGLAAVISKLLGSLQKIPLQNIAGDGVYGIYNLVYPLYVLILLLATAGFPIAVAKFVSEHAAKGDHAETRRVLHICSFLLLITGVAAFAVLFFGAEQIALLIGNRQTQPAIQSVSFALLFVPFMASIRGYFQGYQDMIPTGVSQVVEQIVRVVTMIWLLLVLTGLEYPDSWIAAGATFGSVTGALAGLLVMIYFWYKDRKKYRQREKLHLHTEVQSEIQPASRVSPLDPQQQSKWKLIRQFTFFALPVCLGSIVLPILNLVDTVTMPRLLEALGWSESGALGQFGVYSRGAPLIQLVALLAVSLSVALVPALAEAKTRNQWNLIKHRSELAVRMTWLVGLAASVGMAVVAVPLNIMFFKDDTGSLTMAILAFTALFSTLNIVSGSLLQGVGAVLVPAGNLLVAAAVKVSLNLVLMPVWGIEGAAVSAVIAFGAASLLNMVALRKHTGASFLMGKYIFRPGMAILLMVLSLYGLIYGSGWLLSVLSMDLSYRLTHTFIALIAVSGGALVFAGALFRMGAITQQDIEQVPSLSGRLLPMLKKLRLL